VHLQARYNQNPEHRRNPSKIRQGQKSISRRAGNLFFDHFEEIKEE